MYNATSVITLDGYKYAVVQGGYTRTWRRFFSVTAQANLVTTTFIDRGAGQNIYDISLLITTWDQTSIPYSLGVTQTWDQQKANLEASYQKIGESLLFIDPFGVQPSTNNTDNGIYFTQYVENIQDWSTPSSPYIKISVQLQEAVGQIISS